MRVVEQVCGTPGMMNAVSGDKASAKDQGEVCISCRYEFVCLWSVLCKGKLREVAGEA